MATITSMSPTELLGWLGMFLVAGAFLLNAFSYISSTGRTYLLLNLAGAVGMGLDLWLGRKGWSGPFALQIFWGGVSILALLRPKQEESTS